MATLVCSTCGEVQEPTFDCRTLFSGRPVNPNSICNLCQLRYGVLPWGLTFRCLKNWPPLARTKRKVPPLEIIEEQQVCRQLGRCHQVCHQVTPAHSLLICVSVCSRRQAVFRSVACPGGSWPHAGGKQRAWRVFLAVSRAVPGRGRQASSTRAQGRPQLQKQTESDKGAERIGLTFAGSRGSSPEDRWVVAWPQQRRSPCFEQTASDRF